MIIPLVVKYVVFLSLTLFQVSNSCILCQMLVEKLPSTRSLLVKKEAQNVVSLVESEKEALTIVYSKSSIPNSRNMRRSYTL